MLNYLESLYAPPIRKFYEVVAAGNSKNPCLIFFLVVFYAKVKYSSWPVDIAKEKAYIKLFVIIVVVSNQAER